jgi:hypothetical protein
MVDHRDRCPDEVIIPKRRAQLHTLTFTASDRYRDRRHLKESDLPSVQNPDQKDVHWTRKKVTHDDKQRPVSQFRSSEYNLEYNMTRKHRIQGIAHQRNEIPIASLGDKPFKVAELSPGFFNEGGLISGSTMRPRPVKAMKGSKAEEETLGKSIKSLTAMEKRTQYINDSDKRQVDMLTVSPSPSPIPLTLPRILSSNEAKKFQVGKRKLECGSVVLILRKMTTNLLEAQERRPPCFESHLCTVVVIRIHSS